MNKAKMKKSQSATMYRKQQSIQTLNSLHYINLKNIYFFNVSGGHPKIKTYTNGFNYGLNHIENVEF